MRTFCTRAAGRPRLLRANDCTTACAYRRRCAWSWPATLVLDPGRGTRGCTVPTVAGAIPMAPPLRTHVRVAGDAPPLASCRHASKHPRRTAPGRGSPLVGLPRRVSSIPSTATGPGAPASWASAWTANASCTVGQPSPNSSPTVLTAVPPAPAHGTTIGPGRRRPVLWCQLVGPRVERRVRKHLADRLDRAGPLHYPQNLNRSHPHRAHRVPPLDQPRRLSGARPVIEVVHRHRRRLHLAVCRVTLGLQATVRRNQPDRRTGIRCTRQVTPLTALSARSCAVLLTPRNVQVRGLSALAEALS